ncbi:hypothetical protein LC724_13440 [Blautia sp. RD014234]|nr:hypothetical protein [Blautia parvula]
MRHLFWNRRKYGSDHNTRRCGGSLCRVCDPEKVKDIKNGKFCGCGGNCRECGRGCGGQKKNGDEK